MRRYGLRSVLDLDLDAPVLGSVLFVRGAVWISIG